MLPRAARRTRFVFGYDIRRDLEPARLSDTRNSRELPGLRDVSLLIAMIERPAYSLRCSRDVSNHHKSESVLCRVWKSELTEGNPEFRDPTHRIDSRRDIPDAIPARIFVVVVGDIEIAFHAC